MAVWCARSPESSPLPVRLFGGTRNLPDTLVPAVCADPDRYLFWDGEHPTRAGHFLISFALLEAAVVPWLKEGEAGLTR
jgi:phospholipase/lecithinase/hemolysin